MRRLCQTLCLVLTLQGVSTVEAQHFWHGHHGSHWSGSHSHHQGQWNNGSHPSSRGIGWSPFPFGYGLPTAVPVPVAVTGFPGANIHGGFNPLVMMGGMNGWPQPAGGFAPVGGFPGVVVAPISVKTTPNVPEDPVKRPAKPSTAAGRLKSLDLQTLGDEKLRNQQWAQAYMSYRSAVDAAGDRGAAHFRLAFTFTAMKHYSSAVREFRRGLFLDPTLPRTGVTLETLFGPESLMVRTSILHKVADWVRDDARDPDRLFLLGTLLHYEGDPRARQVLQAAQQMAGAKSDHILALLNAPAEENAATEPTAQMKVLLESLPKLPTDALAMPLNAAALLADPQPAEVDRDSPPNNLPPLSTKPTPIIIGDPRPARDL